MLKNFSGAECLRLIVLEQELLQAQTFSLNLGVPHRLQHSSARLSARLSSQLSSQLRDGCQQETIVLGVRTFLPSSIPQLVFSLSGCPPSLLMVLRLDYILPTSTLIIFIRWHRGADIAVTDKPMLHPKR